MNLIGTESGCRTSGADLPGIIAYPPDVEVTCRGRLPRRDAQVVGQVRRRVRPAAAFVAEHTDLDVSQVRIALTTRLGLVLSEAHGALAHCAVSGTARRRLALARFAWSGKAWRAHAVTIYDTDSRITVLIDVRTLRGRRAVDLDELLVHELTHLGHLRDAERFCHFVRETRIAHLRLRKPAFEDLARQLADAEEAQAQQLERRWRSLQRRSVEQRRARLLTLLGHQDDDESAGEMS
jgi:hypothetical protein